MAAKKAKQKKEKLDIELLALQVRRLANEFDGIGKTLRVMPLTTEAAMILLAELRAVRHLLDKKGQFVHLDLVPTSAPALALQPEVPH